MAPGKNKAKELHAKAHDDATARPEPAKIIQIRKWGCHFDGKDPLGFLEQVNELRRGYGYTEEQLLLSLPELLRGDTLLWYRNMYTGWTDWEDFRKDFEIQYLPQWYRTKLYREIQERRQGSDELFQKYATALLTLMRRAGGYTANDRLLRIHDNMHPDYKLYVRLDDLNGIADLGARATEYEAIERERRDRKKERTTDASSAVAAIGYNCAECCWWCKRGIRASTINDTRSAFAPSVVKMAS